MFYVEQPPSAVPGIDSRGRLSHIIPSLAPSTGLNTCTTSTCSGRSMSSRAASSSTPQEKPAAALQRLNQIFTCRPAEEPVSYSRCFMWSRT